MVGALRGDRATVARTVSILVGLAAVTGAACWAILTLGEATAATAEVVIVLGGTGLTLGFALAPLIAGAEDQLDPRRFAVLGLSPGRLTAAIAVAGFASVPTLALIAVAASTAVMWRSHGVSVAVAVVCAVLAVVICQMLARVCTAVSALVLRQRRSRELSGLFILVVVILVVPAVVFFASLEWQGRIPSQMVEAADLLALTPFAAAWGAPGAIATGGSGVASIVIAVATTLGLILLWAALCHRLLTTTERPVPTRERGGLGWFAVAPGNATGAIAARSVLYWLRDRRYIVNAIIIPFAAVIAVVPPLIAGVPPHVVALIPVLVLALFLGWLPHNDVAYDSTAVWMHISSGTRGLSDRVGRLAPVLLIAVPLLAVLVPVTAVLYDRWAILPAVIGVTAALFFTGLGLSSVASVLAPYPVSLPGDSPFQQPQRTGSAGFLAQALVMLGTLAASAPALWWGWLTITEDIRWADTALWGGIAIGIGMLVVGVAVGALLFDRRGARLMEFAATV